MAATTDVPEAVRQQWRKLARKGHFKPWRLGDGWKYVRRHWEVFPNGGCTIGEGSEGCVLAAVAALCRARGFAYQAVYRLAYPEEGDDVASDEDLAAWAQDAEPFPGTWTTDQIATLIADIGDVNYHQLASVVSDLFL